MTQPTVAISGFDWEDADLRFLAYTDTHFAYGRTADDALASLASLTEVPAR